MEVTHPNHQILIRTLSQDLSLSSIQVKFTGKHGKESMDNINFFKKMIVIA